MSEPIGWSRRKRPEPLGVVYLIRHAQASFGAPDYDVLSALGEEQAAHLGWVLRDRGVAPRLVVSGPLHRQLDTARLAVRAASYDVEVEIDEGYDEFPVESLLAAPRYADRVASVRAAATADQPALLQSILTEATQEWTARAEDTAHDHAESFSAFGIRVSVALQQTAARIGPGESAVVVTSGAVLDMIATSLLDAPARTWLRLQPIWVNTGVTKVAVGADGLRMVTLNDHAHLEGRYADLFSYR